jgi:molybdopterin-guanine dinucleotide biosynthesis protein A
MDRFPGAYDAVVLAGGRARRLDGVDKPMLQWQGRSLLEHVLESVAGAARVIVVGPPRAIAAPVTWCREQPPGGGPVAALEAANREVTAAVVVVLAADLPSVGPAVPLLLQALAADPGADLAALRDGEHLNYLASAWRTDRLRTRLASLPATDGASMRALVAGARLAAVADTGAWSDDWDTWGDVRRHGGTRHD